MKQEEQIIFCSEEASLTFKGTAKEYRASEDSKMSRDKSENGFHEEFAFTVI